MRSSLPWWRAALVTLAVPVALIWSTAAGAQDAAPGDPPVATAPEGEEVVHSWALGPAGADDDIVAGRRADLTYDLAPGTETEDALTLYNFGTAQLTFDLYTTDAFNNDTGQFDLLAADAEPSDVGTWITLPQERITVAAGTQVSFPITVKVPIDATPGDHAGAILASSATRGTSPDGRVVTLDRRTGSRLYVRVAGPLDPQLSVEQVSTSYSPALNPLGGTAQVSYRIENRGNVRLAGTYRASVAGPFGLARETVPDESLTELLPGEGVTVTQTLPGVSATVLAFATASVDPVPFAGDEAAPVNGRSMFLALPLALIGLALALALAWYARRHSLRRRQDGRDGALAEQQA